MNDSQVNMNSSIQKSPKVIFMAQLLKPTKSWHEIAVATSNLQPSRQLKENASGIYKRLQKYAKLPASNFRSPDFLPYSSNFKNTQASQSIVDPDTFFKALEKIASIHNCQFSTTASRDSISITEIKIQGHIFVMKIKFNISTIVVEEVSCQVPGSGTLKMPVLQDYFKEKLIPICSNPEKLQYCIDQIIFLTKFCDKTMEKNYSIGTELTDNSYDKLWEFANDYLLSFHLINLNEVQYIGNDPKHSMKKQAALCLLGSLEKDLWTIFKYEKQLNQISKLNPSDIINDSSIGHLYPRCAGIPLRLDFFITPHNKLKHKSSKNKQSDSLTRPKYKTSGTLHVVPCKNQLDMNSKPAFSIIGNSDSNMELIEDKNITCITRINDNCNVCFEFRLNQRILLSKKDKFELEKITGIEQNYDCHNTMFRMIETLSPKNVEIFKPNPANHNSLTVHGHQHRWYVHDEHGQMMYAISNIKFSKISSLIEAIQLLRKCKTRETLLLSTLYKSRNSDADKNTTDVTFESSPTKMEEPTEMESPDILNRSESSKVPLQCHLWVKSVDKFKLSFGNFSMTINIGASISVETNWMYRKYTSKPDSQKKLEEIVYKTIFKTLSLPVLAEMCVLQEFKIFTKDTIRELDQTKTGNRKSTDEKGSSGHEDGKQFMYQTPQFKGKLIFAQDKVKEIKELYRQRREREKLEKTPEKKKIQNADQIMHQLRMKSKTNGGLGMEEWDDELKDPEQKILESQPGYRKFSYEANLHNENLRNEQNVKGKSSDNPELNAQISTSSQCLLSQMLMTRQNNSSCVSRSLPNNFNTINLQLEDLLTNVEGHTAEVGGVDENFVHHEPVSVDSGWADSLGSFRGGNKRSRPKVISPFLSGQTKSEDLKNKEDSSKKRLFAMNETVKTQNTQNSGQQMQNNPGNFQNPLLQNQHNQRAPAVGNNPQAAQNFPNANNLPQKIESQIKQEAGISQISSHPGNPQQHLNQPGNQQNGQNFNNYNSQGFNGFQNYQHQQNYQKMPVHNQHTQQQPPFATQAPPPAQGPPPLIRGGLNAKPGETVKTEALEEKISSEKVPALGLKLKISKTGTGFVAQHQDKDGTTPGTTPASGNSGTGSVGMATEKTAKKRSKKKSNSTESDENPKKSTAKRQRKTKAEKEAEKLQKENLEKSKNAGAAVANPVVNTGNQIPPNTGKTDVPQNQPGNIIQGNNQNTGQSMGQQQNAVQGHNNANQKVVANNQNQPQNGQNMPQNHPSHQMAHGGSQAPNYPNVPGYIPPGAPAPMGYQSGPPMGYGNPHFQNYYNRGYPPMGYPNQHYMQQQQAQQQAQQAHQQQAQQHQQQNQQQQQQHPGQNQHQMQQPQGQQHHQQQHPHQTQTQGYDNRGAAPTERSIFLKMAFEKNKSEFLSIILLFPIVHKCQLSLHGPRIKTLIPSRILLNSIFKNMKLSLSSKRQQLFEIFHYLLFGGKHQTRIHSF